MRHSTLRVSRAYLVLRSLTTRLVATRRKIFRRNFIGICLRQQIRRRRVRQPSPLTHRWFTENGKAGSSLTVRGSLPLRSSTALRTFRRWRHARRWCGFGTKTSTISLRGEAWAQASSYHISCSCFDKGNHNQPVYIITK